MIEEIRKSVRTLQWQKVRLLLPPRGAMDEETAIENFVTDLRQSSMLCIYMNNREVLLRRDKFVEDASAEVEDRGFKDLADSMREAAARERLIERGYHAILESVTEKLRPRLSPVRHAWAALVNMERGVYALGRALRDQFADNKTKFIKLDAAWVRGENGNLLDADEQMSRMAELVASTLSMLGAENGWFVTDEGKQLLIPGFEQATKPDIGAAIADNIFANSYALLRRAADILRHFGGTIYEGKEKIPFNNGEREVNALSVRGKVWQRRLSYVAQRRLSQMLFQNFQQLHLESDESVRAKYKALEASRLPPDEFVSEAEFHAALGLSQLLYTPLAKHPNTYAGLTILEWLRGYCIIQELGRGLFNADEQVDETSADAIEAFIGSLLVPFQDEQLIAILVKAGLNEPKARAFLEAITFSRTHDDMMDAPLVRCGDGRRYLLPRTASLIHPAMVVLSQLARLRADLAWKGKTFENYILELLSDSGLTAKPYDGEVEIDGVLLWDDHLFVLECKNIALPNAAEGSLFHFFMDQDHAIKQACEKLEWLKCHPEVLEKLFGLKPKINKWIPVVVNGLPFCLGSPINGCFVADASTVGKFFTDPRLTQNTASQHQGSNFIIRQVLKEFYTGKPTPADFLRMLGDPPQYAIVNAACAEWLYPAPLKDDYFLVVPIIVKTEINLETMSKRLGLDLAETKAHQQRIQAELAKLDNELVREKQGGGDQ